MLRRSLVLLACALAGLALAAPAALALTVHVRVEGLNTTLFGPLEPSLQPFTGPLAVVGGPSLPLPQPTPLGALEAASRRGEFAYLVRSLSFGPYVARIGRYPGGGASGWVFKVNGASPPVGADKVVLRDGDRVLWYYAVFGKAGGPPTLDLRPDGRGCYRVLAQDDHGRETPALRAVLRVERRRGGASTRIATHGGRACLGPHAGLVRATMPGAVRSVALP